LVVALNHPLQIHLEVALNHPLQIHLEVALNHLQQIHLEVALNHLQQIPIHLSNDVDWHSDIVVRLVLNGWSRISRAPYIIDQLRFLTNNHLGHLTIAGAHCKLCGCTAVFLTAEERLLFSSLAVCYYRYGMELLEYVLASCSTCTD
jgi:hypothetical protein